ncbi:hypothetical protein FISHEDRAFT_76093 [Fistulina hepatica ATCC 64428]|uniref:Uncharacterized protein n=1 Tax=Fistulina hepatica ATCC 64428 TaxID=1128425 RepID=A0A0D7A4X2_9AGAR|nr:hypothetical protein FISHEDRAFT_76093 [Fistulina hepatica ATCC 64428]
MSAMCDMTACETTQPKYPFLARPPPSRKPAAPPTIPLPPTPLHTHNKNNSNSSASLADIIHVDRPPLRRRSATFASIAAWAAHVHPGSPTPRTPLSAGSSAPHGAVRKVSDASLFGAPKTADCTVDLTSLGYSSVFVRFPHTPSTPEHHRARQSLKLPPQPPTVGAERVSDSKDRKFPAMRLPSLSFHRRAKSSTLDTNDGSHFAKKPVKVAKKQRHPLPPTLAQELALMQFIGGGRVEDQANTLMHARAKAAIQKAQPAQTKEDVGVPMPHRDSAGVLWLDAAEPLEYRPLLAPSSAWASTASPTSANGCATSPIANALSNPDALSSAVSANAALNREWAAFSSHHHHSHTPSIPSSPPSSADAAPVYPLAAVFNVPSTAAGLRAKMRRRGAAATAGLEKVERADGMLKVKTEAKSAPCIDTSVPQPSARDQSPAPRSSESSELRSDSPASRSGTPSRAGTPSGRPRHRPAPLVLVPPSKRSRAKATVVPGASPVAENPFAGDLFAPSVPVSPTDVVVLAPGLNVGAMPGLGLATPATCAFAAPASPVTKRWGGVFARR